MACCLIGELPVWRLEMTVPSALEPNSALARPLSGPTAADAAAPKRMRRLNAGRRRSGDVSRSAGDGLRMTALPVKVGDSRLWESIDQFVLSALAAGNILEMR